MNATKFVHPNADQLAGFVAGQVPEELAAEISLHLADCVDCRTMVDAFPDDTILSLLRKPPLSADDSGEAAPPSASKALASTMLAGPGDTTVQHRDSPPELAGHPRYKVLVLLGTGGMGSVYKAEHRLMERTVALKILNPRLMNRPAMVERFRREVKAAARLSHPHIVTAYDADQAGDAHFLVMEFVEGISLAQHVEQQGPLPIDQACDYIRQAALGLHFAAEHGMVHRDIKPHNLMLTPTGQIKILDFGLARLAREETNVHETIEERADVREHAGEDLQEPAGSLTEAGMLMGTADFVAPEQAEDPRQADIRADIYSLGCTLYYLLSGNVPFPGGTLSEKLDAHRDKKPVRLANLRGDVPPALASVLDRMMAKDPAERYQSAAEIADALRPFTQAAAAQRRRVKRILLSVGMAVASALLAAIIYIQTDNGDLVIETQDDHVAVMVNDKGVKIRDVVTNQEYLFKAGRHRLRPGHYTIDVRELPAGVEFDADFFTLKRGDKTVARVTFNAKKTPGYLKDEALRWFPADSTFFYASNLEIFPVFARLQFITIGENLRKGSDQFWRFKDLLGTVDRASYADADNHQHPDQSRVFFRFTGAIKHTRLVEYFRNEWTGLTIETTQSKGEPITFIYDSKSDKGVFGGAIALVGTTDLIWAAHGKAKKHLDAVRESLELRAGRGAGLVGANAKVLEEIPDNAWVFAVGETPAPIKKHWSVLPLMARSCAMSMSGTNDVHIYFRGTFSSDAQAKLFTTTLNLSRQGLLTAPRVVNDPNLSAAAAQTFSSLQVESKANQVTVNMRIPSAAWIALEEQLQDTPLQDYSSKREVRPANKK